MRAEVSIGFFSDSRDTEVMGWQSPGGGSVWVYFMEAT